MQKYLTPLVLVSGSTEPRASLGRYARQANRPADRAYRLHRGVD